jgi:teichuronic acid biosynthesis glycosyltransferase TuaG
MLIVDDCSRDDTVKVAQASAKEDPRIRVIRQEKNGGPAAARNRALSEARGDWVAFLDSDDLWLPEKLERQMRFHRASDAKITFTEFRRISADGATLGALVRVPPSLNYRRLLGNTAIATSTVLIDRRRTGPIQMRKVYYDDFVCWLDILRGGGVALGLQEDLMRYRVVGGSVSRNKKKSAREVWRIYRETLGLTPLSAAWSFGRYAANGLLKYARF